MKKQSALYIPVYKGKTFKPVTWEAMIRLRSSILGLKWRIHH